MGVAVKSSKSKCIRPGDLSPSPNVVCEQIHVSRSRPTLYIHRTTMIRQFANPIMRASRSFRPVAVRPSARMFSSNAALVQASEEVPQVCVYTDVL